MNITLRIFIAFVLLALLGYFLTPSEPEKNSKPSVDKASISLVNHTPANNALPTISNINESVLKTTKELHDKSAFGESGGSGQLKKLEGSFIEHYDSLMSRYHDGEMTAAVILAENLHFCDFIPHDEQGLKKKLNIIQTESTSYESQVYDEIKLNQEFYFCEGIPKEARSEYYNFLLKAAENNYPPAQWRVGVYKPIDIESYKNLSNEQMIELIRKEYQWANQQLEKAALAGNTRALYELSGNYDLGFRMDKSLIKSLAYQLAALQLTDDSLWYQFQEVNRNLLLTKMTQEQISQAYEMSDNILEEIESNSATSSN